VATRKGPISAVEALRQLEADPEWRSRRDLKEAERAERAQQFRQEQAELLADLRLRGSEVSSVWDLVNTATPYPKALPVLLDHLLRPYSVRTLEGIARALAVKDARPLAWDVMIGLIRSRSLPKGVADGIMVALSAMARPTDLPALIEMLADRSIGSSRILLVRKLMRSKRPEARQALINNRADPDLQKEIAARLGEQAA
jgi:hypothetical protein